MGWSRVVHQLRLRLDGKGLDILHPFQAKRYNQAVRTDLKLPVSEDTLVILLGNTKTLWSPFQVFYQHQVHLPTHPLNDYVESCLQHLDPKPSDIYWPHETQPGRLIAVQKMITVAHLGKFCPVSHLCIHAKYGPWFAIRAILVYDGIKGPPSQSESRPQSLSDSHSPSNAGKDAILWTPQDPRRLQQLVRNAMQDNSGGSWRKWLQVRDQIIPNHPWKFSDEQIQYHYHHRDTPMLHAILRGDTEFFT